MGRLIPSQLQTHLDGPATTTTELLKIMPVTEGYSPYGVTYGNKDIVYDDGGGELLYSAAIGMQATAIAFGGGMAVDNAESTSLMPEFDVPISEADIRAGVYDYAEFSLYIVNYEDLSQGHVTLIEGTLGQISIDANGLSFVNELRGLAAQLKQSVCEKDSLTCRAIYGSQATGSLTPGPIQRFPCGKDATAELVSGTVDSVGLENTLTFTLDSVVFVEDELSPGIVLWSSGLNSGRTYEIESNTVLGEITLRFETMFPIQVGDILEYRPDCNKIARDEDKGCAATHHWGTSWPLHFRGEPDIPIGDAGSMETPGASSSPGNGGTDYIPLDPE